MSLRVLLEDQGSGLLGSPAPRLVVRTINRQMIDLANLYGKKAVYGSIATPGCRGMSAGFEQWAMNAGGAPVGRPPRLHKGEHGIPLAGRCQAVDSIRREIVVIRTVGAVGESAALTRQSEVGQEARA